MYSTRHISSIRFEELSGAYSRWIHQTRQSLCLRLTNAPAGDVVREYVERGKMLRAFLVFAASAAVGGRPEHVAAAAEAIELLHSASLFHDDIIDHASERRGMESLHKRLGVGQALVIGDDLLLRAFAVLCEANAYHPSGCVLEAMEELNRLARQCCRGQFEELCADRWISEQQYMQLISGKTAAPFVAAGSLGVLLGGGSPAQRLFMCEYATHMGIAFQIHDDVLDLTGERIALGKPAGNSLAQRRPMLPLIYAWESASPTGRKSLRQLIATGGQRAALVEFLERYGVFDRVRQVQMTHIRTALNALSGLPEPAGVDALHALATHFMASDIQLSAGEERIRYSNSSPNLACSVASTLADS